MKTTLRNTIALIFLLTLALPRPAHAQEPVTLTDEQDTYPLGLHVATLHDPNDELTLEQVMSPEYAAKFVPSHEETPNMGFHTTGWVRLQVINQSHQSWRLVYGWANMQELDYYLFDSQQKLLEHVATGSARPFAQRPVPNHAFVFTPEFQPNKKYTLYLHLHGNYLVQVPLTMQSLAAWGEANGRQNLELGLFFGALLIMLGYNVMLFLFLRETSYLYYVTFLGYFILYQGIASGMGIYAWGNFLWWNINGAIISTLGYSVFVLIFSHHFLEVKATLPQMSRFIYFYIIYLIIMTGWFIVAPSIPIIILNLVNWFSVSLIILGISLCKWWQGYRAARYFLLAWTMFGWTLVIFALTRLGLLPLNGLTEHGNQVGAVLMVLLFSLALADRINLLKVETEQANQKLHEGEHRLKQFLEALPVGVVVFRTNQLLSYINQRAYELFHLTPTVHDINTSFAETLIKLPRYVAQTNQPYPTEKLPLMQAFQGRSSHIDDLEMGAGPRHQLEIWGKPIFDTAGQVEYAMSVFQDITQRKRNEAELLHYQVHLEQLVASRTLELHERENYLRAILETSHAGIILVDPQGHITFANQRMANMFKCPLADLLGSAYANHIYPEQQEIGSQKMRQLIMGEIESVVVERHYLCADGSDFWGLLSGRRLADEHGQLISLVGNITDITERKQAEELLQTVSRRFHLILATLYGGILMVNNDNQVEFANQAFCDQFYLTESPHELAGLSAAAMIGKIVNVYADPAAAVARIKEIVTLGQALKGEEIAIRDERTYLRDFIPIVIDGKLSGRVWHHLDITARKQMEAALHRANAELDRLAHVDGLTQIANRRRFDQYLPQAWQNMAQTKLPLSLILCDIDYFKLYNDNYGHQMGDDCLRQVAQAFMESVKRSTDLVARYGGEEFVLVLPRTDEAGAKIVAGYLHERIQQLQIPHAASKCSQYITISLGVSTVLPTPKQSPDALLMAADAALYQAKLQGRNRTVSQAVGE